MIAPSLSFSANLRFHASAMKLKLLAVAALTAAVAFAADTVPLTFNAVLNMGKEKRFGIATEGGAHSGWVAVGDSFEGYKVTGFDDAAQSLVLEKDGQAYKLHMSGRGVQTLTNSKATLADATNVINKMKFEEMIAKTIDQQKAAVANMSKQMLSQMGGKVSPEDFAAFQKRIVEAMWEEMKPEDLKNEVARIYSEVFTKEELQGMADFYSTPAGMALIDKQPQTQQELMKVMMPRMMKAMPKIQQMSQEFAQQQAAKVNKPAADAPVAAPQPNPAPASK